MTELQNRVEKAITTAIDGKNLNKVLWRYNFQTQMGPVSKQYLIDKGDITIEADEYLTESEDTFISEYYEWAYEVKQYYLNGEDEDFNEETEGYTEDEMYEALDEWIDGEGWVYMAYQAFVATIITEVMNDIKYEKFDTEIEEYKELLDKVDGIDVEYDYNYDEYGYKTLSGLSICINPDDDDYEDDFIEWDMETGWTYGEYNADDIHSYINHLYDRLSTRVEMV